MKQIRSGTTQECLADYFRRFDNTKPLKKFVDVGSDTIARWKSHGTLSTGETLLRLQYFLTSVGYSLTEFEDLPKPLIELGKCIVLNVLGVEDVAKRLDLCDARAIYAYFRKDVKVPPMKEKIMESILLDYQAGMNVILSDRMKDVPKISTSTNAISPQGELLINQFSLACEKVKELGQQLLDGPVELRVNMRIKMGTGREPALHTTWEALNKLNKLLREETKHEQK